VAEKAAGALGLVDTGVEGANKAAAEAAAIVAKSKEAEAKAQEDAKKAAEAVKAAQTALDQAKAKGDKGQIRDAEKDLRKAEKEQDFAQRRLEDIKALVAKMVVAADAAKTAAAEAAKETDPKELAKDVREAQQQAARVEQLARRLEHEIPPPPLTVPTTTRPSVTPVGRR
jgi:hypothetical protein